MLWQKILELDETEDLKKCTKEEILFTREIDNYLRVNGFIYSYESVNFIIEKIRTLTLFVDIPDKSISLRISFSKVKDTYPNSQESLINIYGEVNKIDTQERWGSCVYFDIDQSSLNCIKSWLDEMIEEMFSQIIDTL